ncbi:MAG: glycosyltransferase [Candidatus Nanopelagicales bacterium]|nr:glycosyltransferase [Candidatus Nanopelagicales bacterium]
MNQYLSEHVRRRQDWAQNLPREARDRKRGRFFHRSIDQLIASQVPIGSSVLDLGCADGTTLAACQPGSGWGVDLDQVAVTIAHENHPDLHFVAIPIEDLEESPLEDADYILMSLLLDEVYDVQHVLDQVRMWSTPATRVVIVTYSRLWRPFIRLAEWLHIKGKVEGENYVPWGEIENMLAIGGFEVTKRLDGVLMPLQVPLLSAFVNRWVAPLPLFRFFCLIRVTVARPLVRDPQPAKSVSIVVAARNEAGHIHDLIDRIPMMCSEQELIFVEGNSTDDTWKVIQEAIAEREASTPFRMLALRQPGKGKGDAVRTGFAAASGEVLMILDADISVPPEELSRFLQAIDQDHCEFANGSRLVYPMDARAMRFLNLIGNKFFGQLFSFLLGQSVRDTLCGTKVLRRSTYERIAANRAYFGDFDPFGDFDLLFGASRLSLKIRDVPVHYKERVYGETNISRFNHGWLLLRMAFYAAKRLKFVG